MLPGISRSGLLRKEIGIRSHAAILFRAFASENPSSDELRKNLEKEQQNILQDARSLTYSLYRRVIRSVRIIRQGNIHDEKEFQERERKDEERRRNQDIRLSMISMLPPVNRSDELRSRAEYYMQYAKENFLEEGGLLEMEDEWEETHIRRFLHNLRQGEKHRQWLLKDMKFPDPYKNSFNKKAIANFEKQALAFIAKNEDLLLQKQLSSAEYQQLLKIRQQQEASDGEKSDSIGKDDDGDDDDAENWFTDDESEDNLPAWARSNTRPF